MREPMSELVISLIIFAIVVGSAFLGAFLSATLPKHHLTDATKDMLKIAVGLVTTLAALVLGLLVASPKNSFDAKPEEVRHAAADIIPLDRNLRQYGPETKSVRDLLHQIVLSKVDLTWLRGEALDRNLSQKGRPASRTYRWRPVPLCRATTRSGPSRSEHWRLEASWRRCAGW
jgi:hypothetical protein